MATEHDFTNGDYNSSSTSEIANGSLEGPAIQLQQQMVESSDQTNDDAAAQQYAAQVQARYAAERTKRLRPDFEEQFVQIHRSDLFKNFTHDPWLPADGSVPGISLLEDQHRSSKFVLQGAGFAGLLYASRLVEAGFNPKDIILVDYAGNFGGTWYWNRYPGLMCDVASDIYMPMLEETGYIPKHRYSYGQELREHAERVAQKYGVSEQGIFRATVLEAIWDDIENVWNVKVCQESGPKQGAGATKTTRILRAQYFMPLTGVVALPRLPLIPGIETFAGHQFHTSRWDYDYTGGSQAIPDLEKLKDKRVGLVGTGPTNIQVLPQLAKWAKSVHLFQRTPASVDTRYQRSTDMEEWNKECTAPGWQQKRRDNFAAIVSQASDGSEPNLVDDEWTRMPSFKALIGGPNTINPQDPSTVQDYVMSLHMLDFPRQERIRARIDSIVKDKGTAEKLKPWYPGWCKRPCFHEDYLPAFNNPNVHLVDTQGKGIDKITESSVFVGNDEFEVDVIIWGTGFAATQGSAPGDRSNVTVRGRHGKSITEKWNEGVASLFGFTTRDFPNFFYVIGQCGVSVNNIHIFEATCGPTVHAIKTAEERHPGKKVMIEPTHEAEEAWSMRVMANAASFAGTRGCTPSNYNSEGRADAEAEHMSMADMMKAARGAPWGQGLIDYQNITKAWQAEGKLEGLEVTVVD